MPEALQVLEFAEGQVSLVAVRAFEGGPLVGPVSYTHLRAHETVLDLVCRLLLEKKNTTTSTRTR